MKCSNCNELEERTDCYYCPIQKAEIFNPRNAWCDYEEKKIIEFQSQRVNISKASFLESYSPVSILSDFIKKKEVKQ